MAAAPPRGTHASAVAADEELVAMATAIVAPAPPQEKFRKDYAPPPYRVDSLELNFDIHEEETLVTMLGDCGLLMSITAIESESIAATNA